MARRPRAPGRARSALGAAQRRELAEAILDIAGALVVVLDAQGHIVRFNHACERATGWRLEEVRGRAVWDFLLLPEEAASVRETFASLAAGHFPNARENHWVARDGSRRLVSWSNTAITGPDGKVLFVVATGIDVTEARAAAEELHRHAARQQALADASRAFAGGLDYRSTLERVAHRLAALVGDSCLVRVVSEDGAWLEPVAYAHRDPERGAFVRSLQATSPQRAGEGLTGRAMQRRESLRVPALTPEIVRAEMKPEYWPYLERAASLLVVPLEVRGRVFGHITMLRDAPGPPYSADDQTFLEDLAVRAAQAIENARLYGLARAAVAARDEFLSIASHELRTPLTALKLAVQNLQRLGAGATGITPELAQRTVATAERQAARLEKLVAALLDVSRIQAGRLDLSLEEVDLAALAAEAVAHLEPSLAESGTPVSLHATGPVRGSFDRLRLGQVVANLVSNAVKYGEGRPVEIEIAEVGEKARLSVRDCGPGIAPEEQGRLFQRFQRTAASRNIGGLGLGLYIVRRIAEAHGGTVRAESEPGRGATFVVELPLCGPAPAAAETPSTPPRR